MFGIRPTGQTYIGKVDEGELLSQCVIHDDSFHHVAVTKQGARVIFCLDGVAAPALNFDANFEFVTDAAVGACVRPDTMVASFWGVIDELCVFNRELSGEEIKGIYDSQK